MKIIAKKLVMMKLDDLKMFEGNPRNNDEAVGPVLQSMERFGVYRPIIARQKDHMVIAGHTEIKALRAGGATEGPVILVDVTEDDAKLINVADNKLAEIATWNEEKLGEMFHGFMDRGMDFDMLGFGDQDINRILLGVLPDILEDEAPPKPEIPKSKPGEIYQLGEHRVMCGDSTNPETVAQLMGGKKAQMVFTDPPYGIDYDSTATGRAGKEFRPIANDNLEGAQLEQFCQAFLTTLRDASDPCASFYICFANKTAHHLINALDRLNIHRSVPLIWDKGSASISWDRYHPQHEMVFYCGEGSKPTGNSSRWYGPKNETTVWTIKRDNTAKNVHPTQKPVNLPARAIKNSSMPGDIVLDVFGGSGSTLIAAEQLKRTAHLMELDPCYIDVIIQRWENFTGKKAELIS